MYEVWIFFVGVSFYPAGLAQYFFPEKQKYKIFSFGCYIFTLLKEYWAIQKK